MSREPIIVVAANYRDFARYCAAEGLNPRRTIQATPDNIRGLRLNQVDIHLTDMAKDNQDYGVICAYLKAAMRR